MNRVFNILLLCAPAAGFSAGHLAARRSELSLKQHKISWSEYEHEYVDPLVPHKVDSEMEGRMDPDRRRTADEFWTAQFNDGKQKLHRINQDDAHPTAHDNAPVDTWAQYKHEYVDPITPHEASSGLEGHMDPERRAVADEFWLQKFRDDKKKMP
eukprot:CAMPEP_0183326580 /NCGR_PEP_ID=MMETSP0160_2-20130417/82602_1 /TAXON_ID=2839 ORGANISM="Odontella Sinensis, Strain Grunow 1884" /NCGR_SAMPLE_ID=MMETSP0160_2 /ASSEMBLY_ACC=CAM_ASM_000250 /LENGTH=154 /DNA_ID=CAMNT_0025494595 /DNA_START=17 /DNA_END=481 /DNA_ORIENTATION=-